MFGELGIKQFKQGKCISRAAGKEASYVISGNGDVIEPEGGVMAIGSGGRFAEAAARALVNNTDMSARDIVEQSLNIAADICVFTNKNLTIEEL